MPTPTQRCVTVAAVVAAASAVVAVADAPAPRQLWNVSLGSLPVRPPKATAAAVYAVDVGGNVVALARNGSTVLWRAALGANAGGVPQLVPEQGALVVGDVSGNLTALDATTGALVWRYAFGAGNPVYGQPAVASGGGLVTAAGGTTLAVINATYGNAEWAATLSENATSGWALSWPLLNATAGGGAPQVAYVGLNSGELACAWRDPATSTVASCGNVSLGAAPLSSAPVVSPADGSVLFAGSRAEGRVFRLQLRAADGGGYALTPAGSVALPAPVGANLVASSPALGPSGGLVYAATGEPAPATSNGTVSALLPDGSGVAWTTVLPAQFTRAAGLTLDERCGALYAVGDTGAVFALDAATGALAWTWAPPSLPAGSGAMVGLDPLDCAVLYVGTIDGYVVALDASGSTPTPTATPSPSATASATASASASPTVPAPPGPAPPLSPGALAGIVVGAVAGAAALGGLLGAALFYRRRRQQRGSSEAPDAGKPPGGQQFPPLLPSGGPGVTTYTPPALRAPQPDV